MVKNKRGPSVEEVLARPWCFYCERDFDDLKILMNHQKAKHYKCNNCGRRLNTAGGLSVHLSQVHKESLETVENALPDRAVPNIEIFGMEGIPDEVIQRHNQRVIGEYHENQAERRAATGNPPPGSVDGVAPRRPKAEDASDMKARLAAFKAKKAAGEAVGQASGNGTPTGAGQAVQSPGLSNSPAPFQQAGAPGYAPPPYPAQGSPPSHFSQPYNQAGYNMPMQQPQFPPQQSQSPFPAGPPGFHPPPPMPGFGQQFPPVGRPPFPFPPPMGSPPPGGFNGQNSGTPAQNGTLNRPPGLPLPPGLPSRPSFQAPSVNAEQMRQIHQGQFSAPEAPTQDPRQRPKPTPSEPVKADGDDIVVTALKAADNAGPEQANGAQDHGNGLKRAASPPKGPPEKKSKKDKEKAVTLVYNDNEVSPEEKMAAMSRYAFDRPKHADEDVVMDSASGPTGANVTGVVAGEDDVIDNQGD